MTGPPTEPLTPRWAWPAALAGLGLAVFAVVALSGPGRIDVCDGQTRFEVGRSLVEHGDSALRDPRVTWSRFPGRSGADFAYYRLPQSVVAAGAILVADATGPAAEGRRHFVFALHGAACCGLLAMLYAVAFRRMGLPPRAAVLWAAAGVFCSPNWYYGTSTFDDILCSVVVVALLVVADRARTEPGLCRVLIAAVLAGLALNCKQPLVAFVLPALALADDPGRSRRSRRLRAGVLMAGAVVGYAGYRWYDECKFPAAARALHAALLEGYPPAFFGNPAAALLDYLAGPASGAVWYFPPVLLVAAGVRVWLKAGGRRRRVAATGVVTAAAAAGFFSLLTFYKGDVAWGPRYLTPLFAAGWLLAPVGAAAVGRHVRWLPGALLAAGFAVQLLALAVDPVRLYVWRGAPSWVTHTSSWAHFNMVVAHLPNRPWEIRDALAAPPAPAFTPAPTPTFGVQGIDPPILPASGPAVVRQYQVWNGLRPWWASLTHLPPADRPVDLGRTILALAAAAVAGVGLAGVGLSRFRKSD